MNTEEGIMEFNINDKVKYLNSVLCEIDMLYQSLLMSKNLSDSEYVVLFAILELGEGCLQKDIADNSYINKKTINSTIKKLERNGLIILKAGKYPNMHIYFTKKGMDYIKENVIPILDLENKFMSNVSDEEYASFSSICTKYIDMFESYVKSNSAD